MYKKQLGFVLRDEVAATSLSLCGTELAKLYPNFNYVLTFKVTSKGWEGRKHSIVDSELSRRDYVVTDCGVMTTQ